MIYTIIFLLVVSLFSYFWLHQKDRTDEAINNILSTYTTGQIYAEFKSNNRVLWFFVLGGVLLTAGFAVSYFAGGEPNPENWKPTQWVYAGVGIVVTVAITLGQRTLYQDVSFHTVAFFITLIVLSFVYMSEMATTDERTDALVRERSLNSPTLNAVVSTIQNTTANLKTNPYASQIAELQGKASEHESKLSECARKYKGEKSRQKCEEYERSKMAGYTAQVQRLESQAQSGIKTQATALNGLISQAKDLEFNEENHTAYIKFIKQVFASSFEASQNFVAFILVNAFEVLFHFIGVRVGVLREALLRQGVNLAPEPPTMDDINAETDYQRAKKRAKYEQKKAKYQNWKPKNIQNLHFPSAEVQGAMAKPYALAFDPKSGISAGYKIEKLNLASPLVTPKKQDENHLETDPVQFKTPTACGARLEKQLAEAIKAGLQTLDKATLQEANTFYSEWLELVRSNQLKHTTRPSKKFISSKLCTGKKNTSPTPKGLDAILSIWHLKAVKDGVLQENPMYTNGKVKFILK